MQYAIVDGRKRAPWKGARGVCPVCGAVMIAKCGPRVIHHWAHKARRNCDPWWENETAWHREWKNHFPEECREVSHTAPDGEVHRADIKTPTGIVIEVQHSPMSDDERETRESFYGNLNW
ncbi:MAG: CoiA-like domain protein, partial [Gammaproteobacteria bacterium]|nr:CoiA-like domain protein [Gammaproteobacteria bacterium]